MVGLNVLRSIAGDSTIVGLMSSDRFVVHGDDPLSIERVNLEQQRIKGFVILL